jgi:[ribosomal protein S18]-alanine N-acetyltransferase
VNLSFEPMSVGYAREIAFWRYEAPYRIYEHDESEREAAVEYLTDKKNQVFAVLSEGELIGFRSFGPDGQVPGGEYTDDYLDTGGGLRPDLTGRGLGMKVLEQGLRFGAARFGTERFRVKIAAFNERALKVSRRLGFKEIQRFSRPSDGQEFAILTLDGLTG